MKMIDNVVYDTDKFNYLVSLVQKKKNDCSEEDMKNRIEGNVRYFV